MENFASNDEDKLDVVERKRNGSMKRKSLFRRSTQRSYVSTTTEQQKEENSIEDYQEAFALLDIDNNGEITKSDLESFMKAKLGENPTESELQEMITEVDVDGNGGVNFLEFLKLMKDDAPNPNAEKDMLEAFLVFDTDRNGFISTKDLRHVMENIGESLTKEESKDFINLIDSDGDGLINYQELVKVLSN